MMTTKRIRFGKKAKPTKGKIVTLGERIVLEEKSDLALTAL